MTSTEVVGGVDAGLQLVLEVARRHADSILPGRDVRLLGERRISSVAYLSSLRA